MYTYIRTYIRSYTHTYTYTHIYMTCICIYIYIHIYINIYNCIESGKNWVSLNDKQESGFSKTEIVNIPEDSNDFTSILFDFREKLKQIEVYF
jgi:hypothetical protein